MTPDTLSIDVRIRDVGRIHRASGTSDKTVRKDIKKMLRALRSEGRLDILRAIRDGQLTFLNVLDAHRRKALHELPVGDTMPVLATAMKDWIEDAEGDYAEGTIGGFETSRRYFEKHDKDARVADLPRLLAELRKTLGAKHPRSFNIARAAALSFTRSTLTRTHAVYLSCLAVEERTVRRKTPKVRVTPQTMLGWFPSTRILRESDIPRPLSRRERMAWLAQMRDSQVDAVAWSMVTTGMGQKELWGSWSIEADRVHIEGTKRGGRVRDIPLVRAPSVPAISRDKFEKIFRARMEKAGITPYHLRRTYIQWLEAAGIPRTRRLMYGGHSTKDVHDLYERYEITEFLAADAVKLRAFLNLPDPTPAKAIRVVK